MSAQKSEEHPGCAACGRTDNDSGLFIWILPEDPMPFCPGNCVNGVLNAMRGAGLEAQADELEASIAQQLAGGWKNNVRLLANSPNRTRHHRRPEP